MIFRYVSNKMIRLLLSVDLQPAEYVCSNSMVSLCSVFKSFELSKKFETFKTMLY